MKSSKKQSVYRQDGFWALMTHRKTTGEIVFDFVNMIFLIILCFAMVYPFVYMLSVSLSEHDYVNQVRLFPKGFTTAAYQQVFQLKNVQQGYINSVIYVVTGVAFSMLLTVLTAYAMSKTWLPGRKALNIFILITMYFGGGLVPLYLVVTGLGMRNTIWAIIVPGAMNTYNMIVMRTYFQVSIPREIEESCEIDGAGQFQTLLHVYLPLAKPILATITLFYLVAAWNAWFPASIYLDDSFKFPIQLVLRNAMAFGGSGLQGTTAQAVGQMQNLDVHYLSLNYALTISVVFPVLVIYPFCQKYFIKGVMVGSLKG